MPDFFEFFIWRHILMLVSVSTGSRPNALENQARLEIPMVYPNRRNIVVLGCQVLFYIAKNLLHLATFSDRAIKKLLEFKFSTLVERFISTLLLVLIDRFMRVDVSVRGERRGS